jgi:hypothetical protein
MYLNGFLVLVGVFGTVGVVAATANASDPLHALRAIGVGVGLLLASIALGLFALIQNSDKVRRDVRQAHETMTEVRDGVKRLRRALPERAEGHHGEIKEAE